jgi:hypothetical protein
MGVGMMLPVIRPGRLAAVLLSLALAPAIVCLGDALTAPPKPDGSAKTAKEAWVGEAFGCRLSVTAAREDFSLNEPILVRVELRNVSNETQSVSTDPTYAWLVLTTDQLGQEVPPTRYARSLQGEVAGHPRSGSVRGGPMWPGQSLEQTIDLSRLCDFTMEGTYSVTIGQMIGRGNQFAVLQAEPLTIRIDGGWPSLSGYVQGFTLATEADRRSAEISGIGAVLKRGTAFVRAAALHDKDEGVREAAASVLSDLVTAAAQAEGPRRGTNP